MENQARVTILLATYNGEKYLEELLESIQNQSYPYWTLIVRDDHSTDQTPAILKRYEEKDERITVEYGTEQLGPVPNFIRLSEKANKNDYVMYCDQDDVWSPSKIERTLETMQELEQRKGSDQGILVYSGMQVTDDQLNPIGKTQTKTGDDTTLWAILAQNPIYGCTMMINRALIRIGGKIPEYVQMHDYYYALCAATYGTIRRINEPLIMYRQHSGNVTGGENNYSVKSKVINLNKTNQKIKETLLQNYRFCKDNSKEDREEIQRYINMLESNKARRLFKAIKYHYQKPGLIQTIRLYWVLLMIKKANL